MAYSEIPSADIQVGKPTKKSIFQKIRDNFIDLDSRVTALSAGANRVVLFEYNMSPSDLDIGKIISADMTTSEFQEIHGTGWVLCNGQSISGSVYASVTGHSIVPDLRDEFLRGASGSVALGSTYGDSTAVNGLGASSSVGTLTANSSGAHTHPVSNAVYAPSGSSSSATKSAYNDAGNPLTRNSDSAGTHTHNVTGSINTSLSGDSETRPQNFGVNFFMKINLSAQDNVLSLKVREDTTIVSVKGYVIDNNGLPLSSDTFEFDILKSSTTRSVFNTIFTSKPVFTGVPTDGEATSSGTFISGGASLTAGDWVQLDITDIMNGQSGIYIQVFGEVA